MVIALDATPLTVSSGGVRRYTEELARALASLTPEDSIHLLSDQPVPVCPEFPSNVKVSCGALGALNKRWWTVGLSRKLSELNCDVFHGTEFSVPYLPLRPSVMSLHDLSPWLNPGWHTGAARVRRRAAALLRLGIPTMTITPTDAVRAHAIERFRIPGDRIVSVPYATADHLRPTAPVPDVTPYFLFVGTLEPRKNVPMLIEAWRELRRDYRVDLVLAGRMRADGPRIEPQEGLRHLGELADDQLAGFYSGALACVYPSLYEGFGLPPLEAMQCGCPVISSTDPALVEVAGGAAIHVDAGDRRALKEAMESILLNSDQRQKLRRLGLERAREFSQARMAQRTREVYVEAIRRCSK